MTTRKLLLKMSITLDGFVGGPNGEIDWIFRSMDPTATAWTVATVSKAGVHAMGSRTFRDMAAHWPTSTEVFAPPMNEIPKVVFSRKAEHPGVGETTTALRDARAQAPTGGSGSLVGPAAAVPAAVSGSWADARVLRGDPKTEIARLKAEPGKDIVAHGGASFAQSLVALDLVDEYHLLVHPVVLGRGLALFASLPKPRDLRLVRAIPFDGGAVAKIYARA